MSRLPPTSSERGFAVADTHVEAHFGARQSVEGGWSGNPRNHVPKLEKGWHGAPARRRILLHPEQRQRCNTVVDESVNMSPNYSPPKKKCMAISCEHVLVRLRLAQRRYQ
eukprot:6101022-Amphidinium_carterae.1